MVSGELLPPRGKGHGAAEDEARAEPDRQAPMAGDVYADPSRWRWR